MLAFAADKAEVRLHSLSVRIQPASAKLLGLNYQIQLTTDSPTSSQVNNELAPLPLGAPTTHGTFFQLNGDIFFESILGTLFLNVPDGTDLNVNGVPDFYEVGLSVESSASTGISQDIQSSSSVTGTWNREANRGSGSLRVEMGAYGLEFTHAFEIREFAGVLDYSVFDTSVTGFVAMTNAVNSTETLSGAVEFDKISSERLRLKAGAWTNEMDQVFEYQTTEALDRFGNQYLDLFAFNDGDPNTGIVDYVLWIITITDSNDADGNGIPDLSDAPISKRPELSVAVANGQLLFSISGELGRVYRLEQSDDLSGSDWTPILSVTLERNPQIFPVPLPANPATFWQVSVP